jgi:hypothetical protein
MDAQIIMMLGAGGVFLTAGTAIGLQMTVRRDINSLDGRVHKISSRLQVIPEKPDDVYARKELVAAEFSHIRESLERVEQQLGRLLEK